MIMLMDSEGPEQTAWMRRVIWTFAVRLYPYSIFIAKWARNILMTNAANRDKLSRVVLADFFL